MLPCSAPGWLPCRARIYTRMCSHELYRVALEWFSRRAWCRYRVWPRQCTPFRQRRFTGDINARDASSASRSPPPGCSRRNHYQSLPAEVNRMRGRSPKGGRCMLVAGSTLFSGMRRVLGQISQHHHDMRRLENSVSPCASIGVLFSRPFTQQGGCWFE